MTTLHNHAELAATPSPAVVRQIINAVMRAVRGPAPAAMQAQAPGLAALRAATDLTVTEATTPPAKPAPRLLVPKAGMAVVSPMRALGDAIRTATAEFMRCNLQFLHEADARNYFRVDAVCIHETEALRPYLRDFFKLSDGQRNRLVASLMSQEAGAAEMLDVSRLSKVYMASAAAEHDGFAGNVLMVFDGPELPVTIEFIGDYAERAPAPVPTPQPGMPPAHWPAGLTTPDATAGDDTPLARTSPRTSPHADLADFAGTDPDTTRIARPSAPPTEAMTHDPDTTRLAHRHDPSPPLPVLVLTVRIAGRQDRLFPLHDHLFPLTVGRHIGEQSLDLPANPLVSRNHLVLLRYRRNAKLLQIQNPSRNGTFNTQGRLPEDIGYVVGKDQWLSLGGAVGEDDTVQIRVCAP